MKIKKTIRICYKYINYLIPGVLVALILFFSLIFSNPALGDNASTMTLTSSSSDSSITVNWSSSINKNNATCYLFVARMQYPGIDVPVLKQYIDNPASGSVTMSHSTMSIIEPNDSTYFAVVDCLLNYAPWVIHSNQLRIGNKCFQPGCHETQYRKGNNYTGPSGDYPITSMDIVRIIGPLKSYRVDGTAPYNDPDNPTTIYWYVQDHNGDVPNYGDRDTGTFDGGPENQTIPFTCTLINPEGKKEEDPDMVGQDYFNQKKNFTVSVSCKGIRTEVTRGGSNGLRFYANSTDSLYVRMGPNPNPEKVLVSPKPRSVAFGGETNVTVSSSGDFCHATSSEIVPDPTSQNPFVPIDQNVDANGTFKIQNIIKNQKVSVKCYLEHKCVGIDSSNDSICGLAKTQTDCANTAKNPVINFCSWGRVSNSNIAAAMVNFAVGAKFSPPVVLKGENGVEAFGEALIYLFNGFQDLLGNGLIADVTTIGSESVTSDTAILKGQLKPGADGNDHTAKGYFRYSYQEEKPPIFCNQIYGSNMKSTTEKLLGPDKNVDIAMSTTVGDLLPDMTYYYCFVGSNDDQIMYGDVKSFKTLPSPDYTTGDNDPTSYSNMISVNTKDALVVDDNSAYLRGEFNTETSSETWFEYRKKPLGTGGAFPTSTPSAKAPSNKFFTLIKDGFNNLFNINQVLAASQVNNATVNKYAWKKIGNIPRHEYTNGGFSFLLKGLSPSSNYEFRAVIKENTFSGIKYGDTLTFMTKALSKIGPGDPTKIEPGYQDPCTNPKDINCNGTGGNGTNGTGLSTLPDLTASLVTPTIASPGVPVVLSAFIINQGSGSTIPVPSIKTETGLNNITPVKKAKPYVPTPVDMNKTTPDKPPLSFFEKIFEIKKAEAAVSLTQDVASTNTTTTNTTGVNIANNGSFYSFFQISNTLPVSTASETSSTGTNPGQTTTGYNETSTNSIRNSKPPVTVPKNKPTAKPPVPTPPIKKTNNTSTNQSTTLLYNIFETPKALAQVNDVAPTIGSTTNNINSSTGNTSGNNYINLPPISVAALSAKSSIQITQNYTFPEKGTYYVRACADKKSPTDSGVILESYENNNCGPWTTIQVGMITNDTSGNGDNNNTGYDGNTGNDGTGSNNGENNTNNGVATDPSNLKLGDTATAPDLAIVHYHEGIETVFARQIVANKILAKAYGYQDGANLQNFAWYLADLFARTFGYVNSSGKEIRVSKPDIAAYQLYMDNGILTVYEYYDSKIVNIQKMTDVLRSNYEYEYYFKK